MGTCLRRPPGTWQPIPRSVRRPGDLQEFLSLSLPTGCMEAGIWQVRPTLSSATGCSTRGAEGAYHLDLRGRNEADPVSVIQARKLERAYIDKWIKNSNMGKYRKPKTMRNG